jgi:hypothetical protein
MFYGLFYSNLSYILYTCFSGMLEPIGLSTAMTERSSSFLAKMRHPEVVDRKPDQAGTGDCNEERTDHHGP